jgi:hypothetical protein
VTELYANPGKLLCFRPHYELQTYHKWMNMDAKLGLVESQVLTRVIMISSIFWVKTSRSLLKVN